MRSFLLIFSCILFQAGSCHAVSFIVDHNSTGLDKIPAEWINKAKTDLHIAYNHTSHGSQLITGINAMKTYPTFGDTYNWSDTSSGTQDSLSLDNKGIPGVDDLSLGDTDSNNDGIDKWAEDTYTFLTNENNYHINVILWSWCNISGHNIDRYLVSMQWLIGQFSAGGTNVRAAYHPVQFVYITAHANGNGENDSSDTPNKQIREFCRTNPDTILFDFSDIENYDPDGNYYLDKLLQDDLDYDSDNSGSVDSNWASEYLLRHPDSERYKLTKGDGGTYGGAAPCAHSDGPNNDARLNCVLKGQAAWYLFARLAGWNPDSTNGKATAANTVVNSMLLLRQ